MEKRDRTKCLLADTLKNMSKQMPLKKISVQDLVKECQVNRSTFYYHFLDIQDLINWIYHAEITVPIHHYIQTDDDFIAGTSERILRCFYRDKHFYIQAIQMEGQNNLYEYIRQEIISNWECTFQRILVMKNIDPSSLSEPVQREIYYALDYFCYGHFFATMRWIREGMPIEPAQFAKILDSAGKTGLFSILEKNLGVEL